MLFSSKLLACCLALTTVCSNANEILRNSGFENGSVGWELYLKNGSNDGGVSFTADFSTAHTGRFSGKLTSRKFDRYGITSTSKNISVKPGDKYSVSAWVKTAGDFVVEPEYPGAVLRLTLFDKDGKDLPGGHFFVGPSGVSRGDIARVGSIGRTGEWKRISGMIEIPKGAAQAAFFFFVWRASGTIWVDDLSLSK